MRFLRVGLLALLVGTGVSFPPAAWPQESRGPPFEQPTRPFRLDEHYPNPVTTETWIPFTLEESFFEGADTGVVTVRIINLLRQLIAIPVATDHPAGRALPLLNLPYTSPGQKLAYWDGKDTAGRRAPSGVYYCELLINGESTYRKIVVVRPRRRNFFPWFGRRNRSG